MKTLLVRIALAAAGVVALLVYLVIADLGMHAGRVHRGVAVAGFDVGGLTELEAFEALTERQELLEQQAVVFIANGFDCRATPEDLGWNPQPFNTAQDAMEVGRGGVFAGLRERFDAWFGGVKVGWHGTVDPKEVDEFLDYCEQNARVVNARVDRAKLRFRIRRQIVTYPRSPIDFNVPLVREPG
ncbi:MAG TPA: hypothetical protein VG318_07565 [Actinomycetota bacterium]|nr:hypothetical protein [Actinomycetota bacterium]